MNIRDSSTFEGSVADSTDLLPNSNITTQTEEGIFSDRDSAYSDDSRSSTQSLTPSIYNYETIYGRTYHAYHAGKYPLPNDAGEQQRCDWMHYAITLVIGNVSFLAPVVEPKAVLDIGTGTGLWAIEFADQHPACEVIGTDLSPIQPTSIPPNLQFHVCDADERWTFRPRFDLVRSRLMNDTSLQDWPHYYREAFRVLRPGGWVEAQEINSKRRSDNDTLPLNSDLTYWEDLWTEGIEKIGLRGHCDPNLIEQQMRDAGFVNVTRRTLRLPIGSWHEDLTLQKAGVMGHTSLEEGIHGLSVKIFTQVLDWSVEALEVLLARCRVELKRKDVHAYWDLWIIYAQKPEMC